MSTITDTTFLPGPNFATTVGFGGSAGGGVTIGAFSRRCGTCGFGIWRGGDKFWQRFFGNLQDLIRIDGGTTEDFQYMRAEPRKDDVDDFFGTSVFDGLPFID